MDLRKSRAEGFWTWYRRIRFLFLSLLLLFLFLFHDPSSNTIHDITHYIVERDGKRMMWKKGRWWEHICDRACHSFIGILGVTYRLAQGVVKHIIPAVASTNAVIAAACALEVFKLASSCATKLDNYMVFNDTDGKIWKIPKTKLIVKIRELWFCLNYGVEYLQEHSISSESWLLKWTERLYFCSRSSALDSTWFSYQGFTRTPMQPRNKKVAWPVRKFPKIWSSAKRLDWAT